MEKTFSEVQSMRLFAGIELISVQILNEKTILSFSHLLAEHDLREQIFQSIEIM